MSEPLEAWIERQLCISAQAMLRGISPVELVKQRPGFGQTVGAVHGAIVASPVLADWDPEPDYFFHWYRDSAIVVDALRLLHRDGRLGDEAIVHLGDFVRFSLDLKRLDGRALPPAALRRAGVAPDFLRFLRGEDELAQVHGDAVLADTRVNPDGSLDISKWARPQFDGAPLRALALLRWLRDTPLDAALGEPLARLLRGDVEFTLRHWHQPCVDIWEEEHGLHYYTLRVSAAALESAAAWLRCIGAESAARDCTVQAAAALGRLDGFWLEQEGHYRSRRLESGARSAKELDIAVIFAAIHVDAQSGAHSVRDPRMQATLRRLDAFFGDAYAINRGRDAGPAMGRYPGDVYHSGGAYYFSTLAAAEFCFRAAAAGEPRRADWCARGDAYLSTVREYTPADGALSEQFDQHDGRQTSARHLTWSYAAFISCAAARRRARAAS